jgi:hypothetical protein
VGYWTLGVPIPVPVDDAVAGVFDNRYIIVVSGWSQKDNVADVQVYDTLRDRWAKSTPIPGRPVFGHSGAIAGNIIVYCGGAYIAPAGSKVKYEMSNECWRGKIKRHNASKIEWSKIADHPGKANYRMAAAAWEKKIVFTGGTDNPYNYSGIGYNGVPSSPSVSTFSWDTKNSRWESLPDHPHPTMDHRAMARGARGLFVIGGMEAGQKVTEGVSELVLGELVPK